MLPDMNRLKVFYYVYSLQSFNLAAKRLHITPSGVSQHIQKLEYEIKTSLFTRLHKKIVPTMAADQLFTTVQPFIEELKLQMENISKPMDKPYGLLRIGAPIEFGKEYLPKICSAFREKYDEVKFNIKLGEADQLLDMLDTNKFDFVLIDYFSAKDQFLGKPQLYTVDSVAEETLILACSRGYYEEKMKKDISFENLVKMDFITDEHEPVILKYWFWHYFKKSVPDLNIVMAIENHQAVLSSIRLGMGLAITVNHFIQEDVENNNIIPVFPGKQKLINKISFVWLQKKHQTITEKVFQTFFKQQIEKMIT